MPTERTYGGYTLEELDKTATLIPWRPCDPFTGWFSEQNLRGDREPTAHIKEAVCSAVNAAIELTLSTYAQSKLPHKVAALMNRPMMREPRAG